MYINKTAPRQYNIIIYCVVIYYYCASRRYTTDFGVVEGGGRTAIVVFGNVGPGHEFTNTHTYIYKHAQINILTVMSARGPRVCAGDCI